MQFKLDENLPTEIKKILIDAGHSVVTVLEQKLGGQNDSKIIEICRLEKRSLLTLDWDFSDIRTYPPKNYSGIIVLNPPNQEKKTVVGIVSGILPMFEKEPLIGRLWIVETGRVRIREEGV